MKPLVIYHANCADGFAAAWAVRQAMDAEFHPGRYGKAPPEVAGRDVILVDFSYPRALLQEMQQVARSILVLDHHKTAAADLWPSDEAGKELMRFDLSVVRHRWNWERFLNFVELDCASIDNACVYALFDIERSGAGITWDFFHPGKARPALIDHVEDRDLWRFELQHTREICATVHSYPFTFEAWDALAGETTYSLYQQGLVLERARAKDVADQVELCRREMVIGHYAVPAASVPHSFASEVGAKLASDKPFAATYYDTAEHRIFSLRAADDGIDVGEVAKMYGGGGHARAAGFTVPRDHELARA